MLLAAFQFCAFLAGAQVVFQSSTPGATQYSVTTSGFYQIDALGGTGGATNAGAGGFGAAVTATLRLNAGETIQLYVAGVGVSVGSASAAGGGGGSFVVRDGAPLVVAGGGGGHGYAGPGTAASLTEAGLKGVGLGGASMKGGDGGMAGAGGQGGSPSDAFTGGGGGAGGGFLSAGGNAVGSLNLGGSGGRAYPGAGGAGAASYAVAPHGGAGGGGGGGGSGGGGGGGYSGGGGGAGSYSLTSGGGGGGGSYVAAAATNVTKALRTTTGNGQVTITLVAAVSASAGGAYTISEGGSLALSGSTNVGGATYSWDVNGDGIFGDATGQTPTLTWTQLNALGINDGPTTFNNVKVRVSDGVNPAVDSAATSLTVNNVKPAISSVSNLFVTLEGQNFNTTVNFSDPAGANDIYTLTIDWGDGNTSVYNNAVSGQVNSHTYVDGDNNYTQTITVTDSDGAASTVFSRNIAVVNTAPVINPVVVPTTTNEGSQVTVTATIVDAGVNDTHTLTIIWGDGNTSVYNNVSRTQSYTHTYADGPANLTLDFQAKDNGTTNTQSSHIRPTITVQNVAPTLTLTGSPTAVAATPYTLNLASNDPGADTISSWTINWGDGTAAQVVTGNPSSVTHTYLTGGNLTISATATDEDGTYPAGNTVSVAVDATTSLIVTNTNDSGAGSLRAALAYAQTLGGAQTITFAPALAGQTVTLREAAGAGSEFLSGSAFSIAGQVTIAGPDGPAGVTLRIDPAVERRHFLIESSGRLTLERLTLTGGRAVLPGFANGGAIWSFGSVEVRACTFTGNHAGSEGGAIQAWGESPRLLVENSTFSGNSTDGVGSALNIGPVEMTLRNVTITGNTATNGTGGAVSIYKYALTLVNSIVGGNPGGGVLSAAGGSFSAQSTNNRLGTGGTAGLVDGQNGNLTGLSAAQLALGALASNGGPTPTHALLPGSVAIDAGVTIAGLPTDQRGVMRPDGGAPDIGAFELVQVPAAAPLITPVAGSFENSVAVSLSTTSAGASIRYTTDGSAPSATEGTLYSGSFTLSQSATVRAIAFGGGWLTSPVASAAYAVLAPLPFWRLQNFGTSENVGVAADGENPDGDALNNLQEFAFGTDPNSGASGAGVVTYANGVLTARGGPTTSVTNTPGGVDFRAVFSRRKNYLAAGLTYTVQFNDADLLPGNWQNSTAVPAVVASDAEFEVVTVRYPFFLTTGKKAQFFRVVVSVP